MNLLIKFPDQSESFAYGVEFCRLLEKIERGDDVIQNNGFPIRVENLGVISIACTMNGYIPSFSDPYMDGWVDFIGIKKTMSEN